MLIDYESVQPETLAALDREYFMVVIFVGANQLKISFEMASTIQRMGDRAQYIKITGNGPNALDFHIAYYIGRISAKEPGVCFHIISKDAGFDPLIQHLKNQRIMVFRSLDVTQIPILKAPTSCSAPSESDGAVDDRLTRVIGDLKKRGKARPKTVKALSSTINSVFQKKLSEHELASLLGELESRGIVRRNGEQIGYTFLG